MTDIFSKEKRSQVMAKVKSSDTKPEMLVRRYLHACGYRYTLRNKKYPGSPDLVFPSLRVAIFVHGCFWHGHEDCKHSHLPQSNAEFWKLKISGNKERDSEVIAELEQMGWRVIVIWECELKNKLQRKVTLEKVADVLFHIKNKTYAFPHYPIGDIEEPEFLTAAEPETDYNVHES